MSTRIRYQEVKGQPGVYKSMNKYRSEKNGKEYIIYLDYHKGSYRIVDTTEQRTIADRVATEAKNLHVLKRAAKRALKEKGVYFDKEARNRDFGVVPKGTRYEKQSSEEVT